MRDAPAGDVLRQVAPVRADVAERRRRAALGRVEAPRVVGVLEQPVLQVVAVDEVRRADVAAGDGVPRLLHERVAAVVEGDGGDDARAPRLLDQPLRFGGRHRQRLVRDDVLAPGQRGRRHLVVQVVRRRVVDDLHVGVVDRAPGSCRIRVGRPSASAFALARRVAAAGHGHDVHEAEPPHGIDVMRPDEARTHQSHSNSSSSTVPPVAVLEPALSQFCRSSCRQARLAHRRPRQMILVRPDARSFDYRPDRVGGRDAAPAAQGRGQASPASVRPTPAAAPQTYTREQVEAGRTRFAAQCGFCHGRDATGGEGGTDLTRSELVGRRRARRQDRAAACAAAVPDKGMPAFALPDADLDGDRRLHSRPAGARRPRPPAAAARWTSPICRPATPRPAKRYFDDARAHAATRADRRSRRRRDALRRARRCCSACSIPAAGAAPGPRPRRRA